jgi:N-acetylglutamate synthase-like GNAT family acetyltransferase
MWVAERDARIVGFAQLDLDRAELEALYVAPDAARTGVGSALLAHAETVARQHALPTLRLQSTLNAQPFYAKRGYEPVRHAQHPVSTEVSLDCIEMTKVI